MSTNNGVLSPSTAKQAGFLTDDVLKITNILDTEAPGYQDKLVVYQKPEDWIGGCRSGTTSRPAPSDDRDAA